MIKVVNWVIKVVNWVIKVVNWITKVVVLITKGVVLIIQYNIIFIFCFSVTRVFSSLVSTEIARSLGGVATIIALVEHFI